jgi:hypothetical protein
MAQTELPNGPQAKGREANQHPALGLTARRHGPYSNGLRLLKPHNSEPEKARPRALQVNVYAKPAQQPDNEKQK